MLGTSGTLSGSHSNPQNPSEHSSSSNYHKSIRDSIDIDIATVAEQTHM